MQAIIDDAYNAYDLAIDTEYQSPASAHHSILAHRGKTYLRALMPCSLADIADAVGFAESTTLLVKVER